MNDHNSWTKVSHIFLHSEISDSEYLAFIINVLIIVWLDRLRLLDDGIRYNDLFQACLISKEQSICPRAYPGQGVSPPYNVAKFSCLS